MKTNYTVREVANMLNVSHDSVTKWLKSGKLKGKKEGIFPGRTSPFLITAEEVERVMRLKNEQAKK